MVLTFGSWLRLSAAGCTMLLCSTIASAAKMNFVYDSFFNARISAVTTPLGNHVPYIDQDTAAGALRPYLNLHYEGYFETDDVTELPDGQYVSGYVTSMTSDFFSVFYGTGDVLLNKSNTGQFTLSFQLGKIRGVTDDFDVFSETSISSKSVARGGQPSASLAMEGDYGLFGQSLTNLYGNRSTFRSLGYRPSDRDYIRYGADVANGVTNSRTLDGGSLRFFFTPSDAVPDNVPDAVPEPATWAMMICGMGLTGAMMRRRGSVRANCAGNRSGSHA